MDIAWADLDFISGSEITYDTSSWNDKIFIPPDVTTPPTWSDSSVSYTVDDVVTHESNEYICILDHTSSSLNEPGTVGGEEEWETHARAGWEVCGSDPRDPAMWAIDTY